MLEDMSRPVGEGADIFVFRCSIGIVLFHHCPGGRISVLGFGGLLLALSTYLYRVDLEMCITSQIWTMVCHFLIVQLHDKFPFVTIQRLGRATLTSLGPRRPARVLSRIRLRSNSARAPNRWNTSLPVLDEVSIASCRLFIPISQRFQQCHNFNQILQGSAETIQPPNCQDITGSVIFQSFKEAWMFRLRPAQTVFEDSFASCLKQRSSQ